MTVHERVLDVSTAVDILSASVAALRANPDGADLEDLVRDLIDIRAVLAQFRDARDDLAELTAGLMPQRQMTVGKWPIERTGGWKRSRWEHEALALHVLRMAQAEREDYAREHDGECMPETEGATVTRLLLQHIGIGYWKLDGFRQVGIEPDDYCIKEPNRIGVKLPREVNY